MKQQQRRREVAQSQAIAAALRQFSSAPASPLPKRHSVPVYVQPCNTSLGQALTAAGITAASFPRRKGKVVRVFPIR